MKGSKAILVVAALMLLFCASAVHAQSDYCLPLTKAIGPGTTAVKYSSVTFHFVAENYLNVSFEKLDSKHVKLSLRPTRQPTTAYCEVAVQVNDLPGTELEVTWPDGNSYIFDTETGYAEK